MLLGYSYERTAFESQASRTYEYTHTVIAELLRHFPSSITLDLASSSLVQVLPPAEQKVSRGLEGVLHFSLHNFQQEPPPTNTTHNSNNNAQQNKSEDAYNNGAAARDRTAGACGKPRRHHVAFRGSAGAVFLEILQQRPQQQQPSRSVVVIVSNAQLCGRCSAVSACRHTQGSVCGRGGSNGPDKGGGYHVQPGHVSGVGGRPCQGEGNSAGRTRKRTGLLVINSFLLNIAYTTSSVRSSTTTAVVAEAAVDSSSSSSMVAYSISLVFSVVTRIDTGLR